MISPSFSTRGANVSFVMGRSATVGNQAGPPFSLARHRLRYRGGDWAEDGDGGLSRRGAGGWIDVG
jgi:hypothetical protein